MVDQPLERRPACVRPWGRDHLRIIGSSREARSAGSAGERPRLVERPAVHAGIGAALAVDGTAVPSHDLWIGATALVHGLSDATLDERDFARIPGLRVVTP